MSSSFFERVIVIIETCLVVSSLRRDIIVRLQNHRAHMEIQHYPENKKKKPLTEVGLPPMAPTYQ